MLKRPSRAILSRMDADTNEQFQAITMSWESARAAYPLIRLHDASISLERWQRFVRRQCRPGPGRAGLIAIRDRRDIVHALFSYRVEFDVHDRRRLCVANLIIAHLPGSQIDAAVAASTKNVSMQFGCNTITVEQPFRAATPVHTSCPTAESMRKHVWPTATRLH
jgi:hypothetical protein